MSLNLKPHPAAAAVAQAIGHMEMEPMYEYWRLYVIWSEMDREFWQIIGKMLMDQFERDRKHAQDYFDRIPYV